MPGKERRGLGQRGLWDHLQLLDHGGLVRMGVGCDDPAQAVLVRRGEGHGQYPLRGARPTFQRQIADHGVLLEPLGRELSAGGEHSQRDG